MKHRKREKSYTLEFLKRIFRPIISITILTALVLCITFVVKGLSTADAKSLVGLLDPVFNKLGMKVDEEVVGEVAGDFISRISQTNLGTGISKVRENNQGENDNVNAGNTGNADTSSSENTSQSTPIPDDAKLLLSVAVMSDVHNDFENLEKALEQIKEKGIETVIYLGDFTELGVIEDLKKAKEIMDKSGLTYYAISGDHDLWKSVGHDNFNQVFGKGNYSKTISGYKFVIFDNGGNYELIPEEDINWFEKEVVSARFVFLSQPLYHPYSSNLMGMVNGKVTQEVRDQANKMLDIIRNSNTIAVVSGDLHQSSQHKDPIRSDLKHFVVGALTDDRNLQSPRYSILEVFDSGDIRINDIVL